MKCLKPEIIEKMSKMSKTVLCPLLKLSYLSLNPVRKEISTDFGRCGRFLSLQKIFWNKKKVFDMGTSQLSWRTRAFISSERLAIAHCHASFTQPG
jgi:hypothetical protein